MKKLISVMLISVMLISALAVFAGCTPRGDTLKILNWAEYIDKSLIKDFERHIADTENGRKIKVSYSEAETNEEMYAKIKQGKRDFDLMCPSDYMIEKMIGEKLLLPITKDMVPNATKHTSPYVMELFGEFTNLNDDGDNLADYAVGYTWGTMGIIFNREAIKKLIPGYTDAQVNALVSSWNALWAQDFYGDPVVGSLRQWKNESKGTRSKTGTISFKNSIRDNYFTASAYVNKGDLSKTSVAPTATELKAIENALKAQKDVAKYWEVDRMRTDILIPRRNISMGLQWAGDAKYSIDEAAAKGIKLEYVIPESGSNVFFDAWVIPAHAEQGGDLAEKFLNFMCDPQNAAQNMAEVGYTSVIVTESFFDDFIDPNIKKEDEINVAYFLHGSDTTMEVWKKVSHVYYPDKAILDKCVVMKNFDEAVYKQITDMWNAV